MFVYQTCWLRAGGSKSANFYHYQYYFGGGKMTLDDTERRYNPILPYTRLVRAQVSDKTIAVVGVRIFMSWGGMFSDFSGAV